MLEAYVWQTVHDRLPELETVVLKEVENIECQPETFYKPAP